MRSNGDLSLAEVRLRGAALAVLTMLSRLPFRSSYAYHWDSLNFLFAMRTFDLLHEQPQPPGYPLYVLAGRAAAALLGDDHTALVALSLIASGVAVLFLYLLGRQFAGEFVGLASALMLATSPLLWFYGEVALPHAVDLAWVALTLWLLARVRRDRPGWWVGAVVALAVTGGFRPQTLIFLLPVALYAFWPLGWRRLVQAALLGFVLSLLWAVPMVASCGGLGPYLRYTAAYSSRFMAHTSVFRGAGLEGVRYNARRLVLYTAYAVGAGWLGLLMLVPSFVRRQCGTTWPAMMRWSLLWALPPLAFYLFVHMGQQGLVFVFLPVLLLWSATGMALAGRWRRLLLTMVVLVNGAVFLLAPEYPLGEQGPRLLTRATLVRHDAMLEARLARLRTFLPDSTAVEAEMWRFVEYYAPTYPLLPLDEAPPNRPAALTPRRWPDAGHFGPADLGLEPTPLGQWFVVLFDEGALYGYPPRDEAARRLHIFTLAHGEPFGVVALEADEAIDYGDRGWTVVP